MLQEFIKLPRLYVDHELTQGAAFALADTQAHYLRNVMRRAPGDRLRLFNGHDGEWLCTLTQLDKKGAAARPEECLRPQPATPPILSLVFAPIKKARQDILIEKAVELGATHLRPVITRNTEIRQVNEDRLRQQIIEAAEQCERLDIPVLEPAMPLDRCLGEWTGPALLACIERSDARPLGAVLEKDTPYAFLIGPEGGFTEAEKEIIIRHNLAQPVSLGPRILRSETAALLALGLAGSWQEILP